MDNALEAAWHVYLNITNGPYKRADLPTGLSELPESIDDLPQSWQDIELCAGMKAIVSKQFNLYLGEGKSLHLDRQMVHDKVKLMNAIVTK